MSLFLINPFINRLQTYSFGSPLGTTSQYEAQSVSVAFSAFNTGPITIYFKIVTVTGTVGDADFSSPANPVTQGWTQTLAYSAAQGSWNTSFNINLVNDGLTETESFRIEARINSQSGELVATSGTVTILDIPSGESSYTTAGTYSFTVPAGVTAISAVAVGSGHAGIKTSSGGGAGGQGGSLRWTSSIAVTPGEVLTVFVGAARTSPEVNSFDYYFTDAAKGQSSYISRGATILLRGAGGARTDNVGEGGGNGGVLPGMPPNTYPNQVTGMSGGGGGAGGYSGNGGRGAVEAGGADNISTNGSGGGGGGGGSSTVGGGGGGVGILGAGASGTAGQSLQFEQNGASGYRGTAATGGSGGTSGERVYAYISPNPADARGRGGQYGAGAGGMYGGISLSGTPVSGGGAVRIIWGPGRSYPNNAA